jgi:hypothetical protein
VATFWKKHSSKRLPFGEHISRTGGGVSFFSINRAF